MTNAERLTVRRERAAKRTCEVLNCGHPQDRCSGALRMCSAHHQRVVRYGTARAFTPIRGYKRVAARTGGDAADERGGP
jgi:hypothetical protein